MSCALFSFLTLADDYACFSLFYCIFVPYLQRHLLVDNVTLNNKTSYFTFIQ